MMKAITAAVLLLAFAYAVSAYSLVKVCDSNAKFNNLMFKFGGRGNLPMFHYWMANGDIDNQYKLTFDRVYAFNSNGKNYKFNRQALNSWKWNLRNCSLFCETVGEDNHDMCQFFYEGNNGEALGSANRMDMIINVEIHKILNINYFKFGIELFGGEMEYILDNYNTFQVGFKFNCVGRNCKVQEGHNAAFLNAGPSFTQLNIEGNMVSIFGESLTSCIFHEGVDENDEHCGLHDFALFVDNNRNPRLSVSWDNAANYKRLNFDPTISLGSEPLTKDHNLNHDYDDDWSDGKIAGVAVGSAVAFFMLLAIIALLVYAIYLMEKYH